MFDVIIVWCDSKSGVLSTRARDNGRIVTYNSALLDNIEIYDTLEVFDVLKRADKTKVAIPVDKVYDLLGWKIT